jgi:hypothetical protein
VTALTRGATVWTRELSWALASGDLVRQRWGVAAGNWGRPETLTVRRAGQPYACHGCRRPIARGELHGSNIAAHYCHRCLTTERPDDEFRTGPGIS